MLAQLAGLADNGLLNLRTHVIKGRHLTAFAIFHLDDVVIAVGGGHDIGVLSRLQLGNVGPEVSANRELTGLGDPTQIAPLILVAALGIILGEIAEIGTGVELVENFLRDLPLRIVLLVRPLTVRCNMTTDLRSTMVLTLICSSCTKRRRFSW